MEYNPPPLVTIGMSTYNSSQFVHMAIESVLSQTYFNFEFIITDDGSIDQTVDIIRSFDDERIIFIEGHTNMGIAYRLNQQIDMAKGQFFFRMDSDDIMLPNRVERQIVILMSSGADVVGASVVVIDNSNKIIGIRTSMLGTNVIQICLGKCFIHPTVCGKISYFRKYHYQVNLSGTEDLDLWIRSFSTSHFVEIDEPMMFYRDPPALKLKTYIFRSFQAPRTYRPIKREHFLLYYLLIFISYIKVVITILFSACGVLYLMKKVRDKSMFQPAVNNYMKYLLKYSPK